MYNEINNLLAEMFPNTKDYRIVKDIFGDIDLLTLLLLKGKEAEVLTLAQKMVAARKIK